MKKLESPSSFKYNYTQWVTVFSDTKLLIHLIHETKSLFIIALACFWKAEIGAQRFNTKVLSITAFLLILQLGLCIGWTSPNFAWLISEESPIKTTTTDLSWIATLSAVASSAGAVLGSISIEYLGTRRTLLLTYVFMCINWTCLLVANSIEWFYSARIIAAIPSVIIISCSCMFLGEISSPETRGTSISLALIGSPLGIVLSTIAETYLSIKASCSLYLVAALIGIVMILRLRDTPYFLIKSNELKSAVRSIEFYHSNKDTNKELEDIKVYIEKGGPSNFKNKIIELQSPVIKKSMFAVFIIFGLTVLCGYATLTTYMEIILKNAEFDLIKPQEFVIYATIVKVIVALTAVKLTDKVGRKILLMISSIGTSIAMFALGLHFYLLSIGVDGKLLQWLPIISILAYLITFSVGFSTVPGTVLSEIFPECVKSSAIFLASISAPLLSIIIIKSYQPIVDSFGEQYAFWSYSLLSLLGIPCAVFLMIETKGKSFLEIQNELLNKWHK